MTPVTDPEELVHIASRNYPSCRNTVIMDNTENTADRFVWTYASSLTKNGGVQHGPVRVRESEIPPGVPVYSSKHAARIGYTRNKRIDAPRVEKGK